MFCMSEIRIKLETCIIILLAILNNFEAVQLGYIKNVTFSASNGIDIPANGSCMNCVCAMMLTNDIVAVNCWHQEICTFYSNYTLSYVLTNEMNSTFYFRQLPIEQQTSAFFIVLFWNISKLVLIDTTVRSCTNATILINTDSRNNDIDSMVTSTVDDCCIWCLAHPSCYAFAWIWSNSSRWNRSYCYRKSQVGSSSPATEITYGYF